MKLLALTLPGGTNIKTPADITPLVQNANTFGLNIVGNVITLLMIGASLALLAYFIFGGWKWLSSEGDSKQVEAARGILIHSVIGFVIVMLSFLIVNVLLAFFGAPQLTK